MIDRSKYEKFIQLAVHMGTTNEEGEETFTFTLEALARIVDIAFAEGQIKNLTDNPAYAEDGDSIELLGALQTQIENALPEGFVELA